MKEKRTESKPKNSSYERPLFLTTIAEEKELILYDIDVEVLEIKSSTLEFDIAEKDQGFSRN